MNVRDSILLRVRLIYLVFFIASVAVLGRILVLQTVQGPKYRKMVEKKQVKRDKVLASRGNIIARDGQSLLATSLPLFRLVLDPIVIPDTTLKKSLDSLADSLSIFYRQEPPSYYKRLIKEAREGKKKDRYVVINPKFFKYLDRQRMLAWPIFKLGKGKSGVIFEKKETRYNPFQSLAKRTVGSLNENNIGTGLEYSFNDILSGRPGVSVFRKIAGGYWKPVIEESKPIEGQDIVTTLDINIQDVAEASLEKHLQMHQADHGSVVLMDVKSGEILALTNLTRTSDGEYVEKLNYAITNVTAPGSTFKLMSYMALFEENAVDLDDTVYAHYGKYYFKDAKMTDSKPEGYGYLTVLDAFAKSSNIATAKLVTKKFGKTPEKFIEYIDKFGLSAKWDFQIKGSLPAKLKKPSDKLWSGISLPWISMGYEVEFSPLQVLTFYNAVANNGTMIKPIIVKQIQSANKVTQTFSTEVIKDQICSEETLEKVRKLLEEVVEHGTATNIKNQYYKIAGKTGTSEKQKKNPNEPDSYYTSFVGYFPAENPKYSCIVTIDNPKGYQQFGSDVAAPVFKEVADKIYAGDIEMHRPLADADETDEDAMPKIGSGKYADIAFLCNQLGISNHITSPSGTWVRTEGSNKSIKMRAVTQGGSQVPDTRGMHLRDALFVLENAGLKPIVIGKGKVVTQSITPGSRAIKGAAIKLQLG